MERPADPSREEEVRRVTELGAVQLADYRQPGGGGWVTLAGPEGNEFCVLARKPASSGPTT